METPEVDNDYQLSTNNDLLELSRDPAYDAWLAAEIAWWKYLDNDPNWIKDHA